MPQRVSQLTRLTHLSLSGRLSDVTTGILESVVPALQNLRELKVPRLNPGKHREAYDAWCSACAQLPHLSHLSLDRPPRQLSLLSHLSTLRSLDAQWMVGEIDQFSTAVCSLPNLQDFCLNLEWGADDRFSKFLGALQSSRIDRSLSKLYILGGIPLDQGQVTKLCEQLQRLPNLQDLRVLDLPIHCCRDQRALSNVAAALATLTLLHLDSLGNFDDIGHSNSPFLKTVLPALTCLQELSLNLELNAEGHEALACSLSEKDCLRTLCLVNIDIRCPAIDAALSRLTLLTRLQVRLDFPERSWFQKKSASALRCLTRLEQLELRCHSAWNLSKSALLGDISACMSSMHSLQSLSVYLMGDYSHASTSQGQFIRSLSSMVQLRNLGLFGVLATCSVASMLSSLTSLRSCSFCLVGDAWVLPQGVEECRRIACALRSLTCLTCISVSKVGMRSEELRSILSDLRSLPKLRSLELT